MTKLNRNLERMGEKQRRVHEGRKEGSHSEESVRQTDEMRNEKTKKSKKNKKEKAKKDYLRKGGKESRTKDIYWWTLNQFA
jgi:hypothetical protein